MCAGIEHALPGHGFGEEEADCAPPVPLNRDLQLVREEISREIQVHIISEGGDRENAHVIVADNAGGMTMETLKMVMKFKFSREARGFRDERPDGDGENVQSKEAPTHGLSGRISQHGLGTKTASYQMAGANPEKFEFYYRTRHWSQCAQPHSLRRVCEAQLSMKGMKEAEASALSKSWTKAPKYAQNAKEGQFCKLSLMPDQLREHPAVKKLCEREREEGQGGFTTMFAGGIRADYIAVSCAAVVATAGILPPPPPWAHELRTVRGFELSLAHTRRARRYVKSNPKERPELCSAKLARLVASILLSDGPRVTTFTFTASTARLVNTAAG